MSSSRNQLERRERVVELARPILGRQCAAGLHKTVNPHGRQSDLMKLVNNIPPAPLRAEGPGRRTEKSKGPWERHFQVHSDNRSRDDFCFQLRSTCSVVPEVKPFGGGEVFRPRLTRDTSTLQRSQSKLSAAQSLFNCPGSLPSSGRRWRAALSKCVALPTTPEAFRL